MKSTVHRPYSEGILFLCKRSGFTGFFLTLARWDPVKYNVDQESNSRSSRRNE